VFDDEGDFAFANPASIYGPGEEVPLPVGVERIESDRRIVAVIGAAGAIGGFTLMNDWLAPELSGAKRRDFATSLGPVLVTPDELSSPNEWTSRLELAGRATTLLPGDLPAGGSLRWGPYPAGRP